MASLKEVKNRIASVQNTRKITSAMKMVASAKLHKAQTAIENMHPYKQQLEKINTRLAANVQGEFSSPYAIHRDVRHVILLIYASNSSLCGGYNSNVIKRLRQMVATYKKQGVDHIEVIPIGRKAAEATTKLGFSFSTDNAELIDKPSYTAMAALATNLMKRFQEKKLDKVELIYHRFLSSASQVLTQETYLPMSCTSDETPMATNYLIEPSVTEILQELLPKVLCLKLFTALLDSVASEHAARVIAMQIATDNADELLQELTLTYNKTRQQAITTELLDIVGGQMR